MLQPAQHLACPALTPPIPHSLLFSSCHPTQSTHVQYPWSYASSILLRTIPTCMCEWFVGICVCSPHPLSCLCLVPTAHILIPASCSLLSHSSPPGTLSLHLCATLSCMITNKDVICLACFMCQDNLTLVLLLAVLVHSLGTSAALHISFKLCSFLGVLPRLYCSHVHHDQSPCSQNLCSTSYLISHATLQAAVDACLLSVSLLHPITVP